MKSNLLFLIALTLFTACTPRLSKLTSGVLYEADYCHTLELRLFKNGTFFLIQTTCDVAMHDLAFGKYQFKEGVLHFEYDEKYFFDCNSSVVVTDSFKSEFIELIPIEYAPLHGERVLEFIFDERISVFTGTMDEDKTMIPYSTIKNDLGIVQKLLIEREKLGGKQMLWLEDQSGRKSGFNVVLPEGDITWVIQYPLTHTLMSSTNSFRHKIDSLEIKQYGNLFSCTIPQRRYKKRFRLKKDPFSKPKTGRTFKKLQNS